MAPWITQPIPFNIGQSAAGAGGAAGAEWITDYECDTITISGKNAYSSGSSSSGWKYRVTTDAGFSSYTFQLSFLSGTTGDFFIGLTDSPSTACATSPETYLDQAVYLTYAPAVWRVYNNGTKVVNDLGLDLDAIMKFEFTDSTTLKLYADDIEQYTWTVGSSYQASAQLTFIPNQSQLNAELDP